MGTPPSRTLPLSGDPLPRPGHHYNAMKRGPVFHRGMKPNELRRRVDPRLTCQCLSCLYGRALLLKDEQQSGIGSKLWTFLVRRQAT